MLDSADQAEIIRRARQRWMRTKLPKLIFTIHMMLFMVGCFGILAASQVLWDRLGFPPGWIILGWLMLLIVHYGGTTIWSSYRRAIDTEIEQEREARARAWTAEKQKLATPAVGIGDDGELFEYDEAERLRDEPERNAWQR